MDAASRPSSSKAKTYSVAAMLVLVGIIDLIAYINGIFETPKSSHVHAWTAATLLNMVFGAVFAVCYLLIRNGPAVLFIPSRVFAFLWILVANFLLLWYIAYMIIYERDLVMALLPYSDQQLDSLVPMRNSGTEHDRKRSKLVVVFSWLVAVVLLIMGIRAAILESPVEEWKSLTSHKWLRFVYTDCVSGALFIMVYIAAREGTASLRTILWVLGVLLLGNMVSFAYVATMATQAVRRELPVWHVMLSKVHNG